MAKDLPGNAMGSQAAFEREVFKTGSAIFKLEHALDRLFDDDVRVSYMKFRAPQHEGDDWLVILTGESGAEKVVAFESGDGFPSLIRRVCNKLANGGIEFRKDKNAD